MSELQGILSKELFEELVNGGRIEIFDENIVAKIVSIPLGEEGYLRLIVEKAS